MSLDQLPALVAELKSSGKKIVTTNGAFDLLHIGHTRALQKSKSLGDILIVGVNSDASVKQYKSPRRPIIPERERAEMLAALSCVDYVVLFEEDTPLRFLEAAKPDIHTKGGDYDPEQLKETELIRRQGGVIFKTESIGGSSTGIIERILGIYGSIPPEADKPGEIL